jgi:hypothetical protein
LDVQGVDEDGYLSGRTFYLADVEAFEGPCIVIPDIGGPPNAYFQVKNRSGWSNLFVEWLRQPHEDMIITDQEEEGKEEAKQEQRRPKHKRKARQRR